MKPKPAVSTSSLWSRSSMRTCQSSLPTVGVSFVSRTFLVGPLGVIHKGAGVVWRFHDKADAWRVSLGPEFIALDSAVYMDREDFFGRFKQVLVALETTTKLTAYDRLC